jgi:hypothetical protein
MANVILCRHFLYKVIISRGQLKCDNQNLSSRRGEMHPKWWENFSTSNVMLVCKLHFKKFQHFHSDFSLVRRKHGNQCSTHTQWKDHASAEPTNNFPVLCNFSWQFLYNPRNTRLDNKKVQMPSYRQRYYQVLEVTIDRVWTDECIYWPLTHTT